MSPYVLRGESCLLRKFDISGIGFVVVRLLLGCLLSLVYSRLSWGQNGLALRRDAYTMKIFNSKLINVAMLS